MSIVKKAVSLLTGKSKLDGVAYCEKYGFKHGTNFQCYNPYAIDANFPWLITIGDNVTLASEVRILAHDARTAKLGGGVHTKIGIVTIGNNVFVGADSVILCNTRIGDNVVIGANSVVSKDVPSNSVYAGNPAKYICSFDEYCEKHTKNQSTHPVFREHKWDEWKDASLEEKEKMKKDLEKTFGYL